MGGTLVTQTTSLSTAGTSYGGILYQYIGDTDANYTNGYFYKRVPVNPSVTFTPKSGTSTVVTITPENFYAFLDEICAERSFTPADVTHGSIGYYNTGRYSFTVQTADTTKFAYLSYTPAELEAVGFTFTPALSASQGVTFVCSVSEYSWEQVNVQPSDSSTIQVDSLPQASASEVGNVYQYIGTTGANYTHGYFYECTGSTRGATASQTAGSSLSDVAVDIDTFETQITTSGSYDFVYDDWDGVWKLSNQTVNMADYGITYTGTPEDFDTITVVYSAGTGGYVWSRVDVQPASGGGSGVPTLTWYTVSTAGTTLTIADTSSAQLVKVYKNGLLLQPTEDYTISGTTLTTVGTLVVGDKITTEVF